jgi:hypothetical protein
MRYIFITLLFLLSGRLTAQVFENFADGDFTTNPEWTGTSDRFIVNESSTLQLSAPVEADKAWLFTESEAVENAQWQFYFRMNFNPSANNYTEVYLTADHPDVNFIENSFYLVLGTTSDNISLWEKRAGVARRLINGIVKRLDINNVTGMVRVKREAGGLFVLESNIADGGWVEEGRCEASVGITSVYFGLSCHYTQTRSRHFFFDDIEITGEVFSDTVPPTVTDFDVMNRYRIRLRFSKAVETLFPERENFSVSPNNVNPDALLPVDGDTYALDLLFNKGIPVETDELITVSGLKDGFGNIMPEKSLPFKYEPVKVIETELSNLRTIFFRFNRAIDFEYLTTSNFRWNDDAPAIDSVKQEADDCLRLTLKNDFPNGDVLNMYLDNVVALNGDTIDSGPYQLFIYLPYRNDIVITELMPDPSPVVGLPDCEYIELYNRGEFPVQLQGFVLAVGNRSSTLKAYLLYPDDYLLLIPSTQADTWETVPNRLAVTGWSALPNASGEIVLYDNRVNTITALRYNITEIQETGFKREGGWSIEIKDADNLSGDPENRAFSTDPKGGTPSYTNANHSNYPDTKPPLLLNNYIGGDSCVVIEFSEPIHPILSATACTTEPPLAIHSVRVEDPFLTTARVCFEKVVPANRIFDFNFADAPIDWAGNQLADASFKFGVPVPPEGSEVVINELLYNPPTNGSDYVELYNLSDNLIDLSQFYLSKNAAEGVPDKLIPLSTVKKSFFPNSYLAFTPDRDWLLNHYSADDEEHVQQLVDLPNYSNGNGTVFLTNVQGDVFDRFDYDDKMHFALLTDTKGVALERINAHEATSNLSNWHSAAATHNYGTPGKENSQSHTSEKVYENNFITIEPPVFTPNQDGTDDILFIHYSFEQSGFSCSVTIFDRAGHTIRHLENNTLVGAKGFFTWNGLDNDGRSCSAGIYIVTVRAFHIDGKVHEAKKTAVLGYGRK